MIRRTFTRESIIDASACWTSTAVPHSCYFRIISPTTAFASSKAQDRNSWDAPFSAVPNAVALRALRAVRALRFIVTVRRATPQIGGQIGVTIDFPDVLGSSARQGH
jgi:hypothetical protein